MDYALGKQLKVAGFPQDGGSEHFAAVDGHFYAGPFDENCVYLPRLEELIEACDIQRSRTKEPFFSLSWRAGEWRAFIPNVFSDRDTLEGYMAKGADPETAVANLWLAMNPRVTVTIHDNRDAST
jgi:hypothetical protein